VIREATNPEKVGSGPISGIFFNRATAHTREPIFMHNSSKDAIWCKEYPFWDEKCVSFKFDGVLP